MYEIVEHEEKTITQLKESEKDVLLDKSSTLDEKIRAASNKR